MDYRIVSADDHIDMQWLPKDLWQKRVPAAWRERAPKVVDTPRDPTGSAAKIAGTRGAGARAWRARMGGRRMALEKGGVLEPGVLRPTTTALRLPTWTATASTPP